MHATTVRLQCCFKSRGGGTEMDLGVEVHGCSKRLRAQQVEPVSRPQLTNERAEISQTA